MNDFPLRAYTKKELALLYFPYSAPRTAVNHLMSWIRRNEPLWQRLAEMGYNTHSKGFTPREMEAVVAFLGAPCTHNGTPSHGMSPHRTG